MRIEKKHSSIKINSELDYLNLDAQINIELLWFSQSCVESYNVPSANFDVPSANFDVPSANFDILTANFDIPSANFDILTANFNVEQNMLLLTATNNWSYCITHHEPLDLSLTRKA